MSTSTLTRPEPLTVPYSDIPALPFDWGWPGMFAYGFPVLWAAPGGTGKGVAIARCAATVTTGDRWPGEPEGTTHEPGSVVLVAPEDDPNRVTRPRLDAAGADLRFVHDLSVLPGDEPFMWPACKDRLRTAIREVNRQAAEHPDPADPDYMLPVKFLAIDPLYRTLEKAVSNQAAALRLVVPLESIAREFSLMLVVSHHTTKDGKTVSGSKALTDAFRVVFLIGRPEDSRQTSRRELTVFKANILPDSTAFAYDIEGTGQDTRAVFSDPEAAEDTSAPVTRHRVTTADLAAAQGAHSAPPAAVPAPDKAWRVLRRVSHEGAVMAPVFVGGHDYPSQAEAFTAAQRDELATSELGWVPVPDQDAMSTAVLTSPGQIVSWCVYEVAARPVAA